MLTPLAESYAHCRQLARRTGSNFYYSFYVLPRAKREAMCAIYAFMRRSDDIADSAANPAVALEALRKWRTEVEAALSRSGILPDQSRTGVPPVQPDDAANGRDARSTLPALVDVVRRYNIPPRHFFELLDGVEMDQTTTRYATFPDLYQYCYRVASCVGLVVLPIFGYETDEALKRGEACGIAFQLTNILRDVQEDARLGRIYLPLEDLEKFGVSEDDIMHARATPPFQELMRFEANRTREYYDEARPLIGLISPDSRRTLGVMIDIYRGILDKIERSNFAVFDGKIRLSTAEKWVVVLKHLWRTPRCQP